VLDGILRQRPGIGDVPVFPSPADASQPIDRYRIDRWLRQAEEFAEVEHLSGTCWHAYRRKWGSEMAYEAPTVVAKLGGWKRVETMQRAYQKANLEMQADVLSRRREYREAPQKARK
jgi:integrase